MSIIFINGNGATATTIETLKRMIENGEVIHGDYYAVELHYSCHANFAAKGTPNYYPVKFKGIKGRELWLSDVTLGYRGEGPTGTQTALKLMGFDAVAANEALLFEQKAVHETFYKEERRNDRIEYYYDQMYATSDRLKAIIEKGITEDTLKEFEREALTLKWEGGIARNFRRVVSETIEKLLFSPTTEEDTAFLKFLAAYPRKCADTMAATDKRVAEMFGKL